MTACEFCTQYTSGGECRLELKLAKGMGCREFVPNIGSFCSNPKDFDSPAQIVQMATFFGLKGTELKKVKLMAAREESIRS
jgi:hypothetical protein